MLCFSCVMLNPLILAAGSHSDEKSNFDRQNVCYETGLTDKQWELC